MPGAHPAAVSAVEDANEGAQPNMIVEADKPSLPPAPPFPTFENTPTLPGQAPGNGFESGRDSRAR